MIQQLLHTFFISIICMLWGVPVHYILSKKLKDPFWPQHGFPLPVFLFFSGFLLLSVINYWIVLFIPLTIQLLLIESLLLLLLLPFYNPIKLIKRNEKKEFKRFGFLELSFFISIITLLILLSALPAVNRDSGIYHFQIIKWINEYGTVPGLANLYPRFATGSGLFNMTSLFFIPALHTDNFSYINLSICIWSFTWVFSKWHFHFTRSNLGIKNRSLSFYYLFILAYFIFDWQLLRDTANSAAYDFIVTSLGLMCISFIIEDLFNEKQHRGSPVLIIFLLTIPTFKLSGALMLVLILHQVISGKQIKLLIPATIAGILIIVPVLISNYITSGYALFPIPISIGHPDWQFPQSMAVQFQDYISNANRFYNSKQFFVDHFEKTQLNWIPYWWNGILIQHKILFSFCLFSILLLSLFKKFSINHKKSSFLIYSCIIMIAVWFFSAPDPRFAYGFLLPVSIAGPALVAGTYNLAKLQKAIIFSTLIFSLIYSTQKFKIDAGQSLLRPSNIKNPDIIESKIKSLYLNQPLANTYQPNPLCFSLPLPCVYQANPYLEMRGQSIKDGFKMKKEIDSIYIKNYQY